MRSIGQINDEQQAKAFGDFLYAHGIDNQVDAARDGGWDIWVISEDQLFEAGDWLGKFKANPNASGFYAAGPVVEEKRRQAEQQAAKLERLYKDRSKLWPQYGTWGSARLTTLLMGISVLVGLISMVGYNLEPVRGLFISNYVALEGQPWWVGLVEIRHGQLWRLITPIFLHFGPLHIIFNLMWMRDLGGMVEPRVGIRRYGLMVLLIAAVSNVAQYAVSGPNFGGLSGIVYALLGYVWIKGKLDPRAGLSLHPTTVTMMLVWFFLGFTGWMNLANTVHGVGLAMGMGWAYVESWGKA